jgi:H+/Cl- antiporter ClcA
VQERNLSRWATWRAPVCALAVAAMLCGGAAGAPVALAANVEGGNAFNELSSKAQEEENTTSTATTTGTSESEAHNSNKTILIAVGVAIVLLVAIAAVIIRDARRVAPAGAEELAEGGSGRDHAVRRRNRRAKAKAARTQRKKNR